jgi:hypothetical protein
MPHEDGDVYYPMVATVSLNDGIILDVYGKSDDGVRIAKYRIYQEPRRYVARSRLNLHDHH